MKKHFTLILTLLMIIGNLNAQHNHWCLTDHLHHQRLRQNPQMVKDIEDFEKQIAKMPLVKANKSGVSYTVPVVFHVVYEDENGPENIPAAHILAVVDELNRDFQKLNPDTINIIPAFRNIIGDADIQFRLATIDPNGNCTNGITRTFDPAYTNDGRLNYRPVIWPRDKYLNIWIVKEPGPGSAAFAFLPTNPNAPAPFDGVVIGYPYINPNNSQFSVTLTHEVGHCFFLYHTWGSQAGGVGSGQPGIPANCNDDDQVTDTPNTIGTSGGCNLNQNTCGSLDNVQNYMDYAFCGDYMFTQGQTSRMINTILTRSYRSNLVSASNLIATGTDDVTYSSPPACPPTSQFRADKRQDCEGGVIQFTNRSHHAFADPSTFTYNWSFPGGTPSSSTMEDPQVTYNTAGQYDVTLNVSVPSASGSGLTRNAFMDILPGSGTFIAPYTENISDPSWPNSSDPSLVWQRTKPASSLFQFQRASNAFYSPPASIFLNNFGFNGSGEFELTTPPVDMSNLTGSAFLKFRHAYRKRGTANEILQLWASTNCGESFSLVRIINTNLLASGQTSSNSFVPADTSEWGFRAEDVSSFAGEPNVIFSFRFGANGGNNLWLDDISVSDNPNPEPITALGNEFEESFSLYPNPNEGQFRLDFFWDGTDAVSATIVDIIGKESKLDINEQVIEGWNSLNIDTRELGLESGVYFLNLNSGESNFTKRVIIK